MSGLTPKSELDPRVVVSVTVEVGVDRPDGREVWTVTDAARAGWEQIRQLEAPIVDVLIEETGDADIVRVDLEEVGV
jgi:hypothetical protein